MVKTRRQVKASGDELIELSKVIKRDNHLLVSKRKNASFKSYNDNIQKCTSDLSAAQTIGRNIDIMSLIIRMLPDAKDRKNLKSTCRKFYHLCNDRKNNRPFLKFLDRQPANNFNWEFQGSLNFEAFVRLFDSTLTISVPCYNHNSTNYLNELWWIIKFNNFNIRQLKIEYIDNGYFKFFQDLNCFEFVEIVFFDVNNSILLAMSVFDQWTSLRPRTIKFTHLHPARYSFQPDYTVDGLLKIFPDCVKNIQLNCSAYRLAWLFDLAFHLPVGRFDTLEFGDKFLSGMSMIADFDEKIVKLIQCFKHVRILLEEEISFHITKYFLQNLAMLEVHENIKIEYDINITLIKMPHSRFRLPINEWMPDDLDSEKVSPLFLNMKCLRITCGRSWIKPPNIFRNPFPGLIEKMLNLVTLEMSIRIFNTTDEFNFFINKLSNRIKDVKLIHCEKLDNYSMELLTTNCPQIENLSLESVKWTDISVQSIISLFKNLKCLSVFFIHHCKNLDLFKKLVGADNKDDSKITIWPKLDFLQVVFDSSKVKERIAIKKIEKNTPRKSGMLLVKYHPKSRAFSSNVLEIIIQKRTRHYSEFINIFTKPCWIKK